jgi:methionine sulfoxide reductase heme-binding subunit
MPKRRPRRDTAAAIGPRAWRMLHLTGGYYLLLLFSASFGKRIPDMPLYARFLVPLLAVFILRMLAMAPRVERMVPAG